MKEENINTILVIGNGFDLALNRCTRYSDYICFIKKALGLIEDESKCDKKDTYIINRFNAEQEKIIINPDYEGFIELAKNNRFLKYFIDVRFDIKIWADVEEEIKKICKSINNIFNEQNLNNGYITELLPYDGVLFVRGLDSYALNVLQIFNLVSKEEYFYEDSEDCFALNSDFYDYVYRIKWDNLVKYLLKELDDFKKSFSIYLKIFEPIIFEDKPDEYTIKELDEIKPDYILSFNYTDYCEKKYNVEAINVHGSLNDNTMVLGFGDEKEFDIHYAFFSKYVQRIENKLPLIKRSHPIFNIISINSERNKKGNHEGVYYNRIIFYGTSFDLVDKDYIVELFNTKFTEEIKVYYYDRPDYINKLSNLISIFGADTITNYVYTSKLEFIPISRKPQENQEIKQ